jgi:hypothetical protein
MNDRQERVQRWMNDCVPRPSPQLSTARCLKRGTEREVWDCMCITDTGESAVILTVFKAGSRESVNTNLPPGLAAEKCFLAMSELRNLRIPTPHVFGQASCGGEGAVLCEKVVSMEWLSNTRVTAARILARLHNLRESCLSNRLRELAQLSDPREYRTTRGHAPRTSDKRLVHGDYFSKNILLGAGGLCIIDWETFGWGDPMWDLGFLIGADRNLTEEEIEAVITEYGSSAPLDRSRLMWHKRRWSEFWKEREQKPSNKPMQATPSPRA